MASNNRNSIYTVSSDHDKSKGEDAKKDMWLSMLDNVASGKRLPEKNLLVLGGTAESQKEFLESLSVEDGRKPLDRQNSKQPPIANDFALGYTYQDVLDGDHEDILARISLYLLSDPSPSFAPLLQPLLTPERIPNTLVVILLDWSQPWFWLRELRDWIRLLRTLILSLSMNCKDKMEEVMMSWRDRGRGAHSLDGGVSSAAAEGEVSLPLGPGEWEEPLGLPLCVVCQNSDRIEALEKERGWREEEFDFVLQFLRTILLKHGASLIYTIPSVPSPIQSLIHSSLGIHSLIKKQPLKHNLIDRDKIVVPPNWDSWGKIRVLREGFDVEAVNKAWSLDIDEPLKSPTSEQADDTNGETPQEEPTLPVEGSAVSFYEETIRDPSLDALQAITTEGNGQKLEVSSLDAQDFLSKQLETLDKIRQAADTTSMDSSRLIRGSHISSSSMEESEDIQAEQGRVNEHIGPVQFNMGGIQVDADDMLQRLKDRQTYTSPEPSTPGSRSANGPAADDGKSQNEALSAFFAGLMKRGGGSASSSPKPGAA